MPRGVQVAGNIIGLNTNGSEAIPNGANGVLIDGNAHNNLIGGEEVSVIFQNTISSNGANGVAIVGNALDNTVFHCFIGTDIEGLLRSAMPAPVFSSAAMPWARSLGATGPLSKNVISANLGGGIQLSGQSQGTQVIGDLIGTDRNGVLPLGNHGTGVLIVSSANQIGGTAAGDANVIAFNLYGVMVDTGVGNAVLGDSIFSNTVSGILLVSDGNLNQSAPVLTGAYEPTPATIQVGGTLTAAANTTYTVQVFASTSDTPAGQGQVLLGTVSVLTNANGIAAFVMNSSYITTDGGFFSMTATAPANDTSAFSAAIAMQGNANTIFVASAYSLLLGRPPEALASGWVNALNNGASPESIVLGIESSAEYLTDQVTALYVKYLNRQPDAMGEQGWVAYLQAGHTLEQVAEGIVSSPEYFQMHGGTNQDYVVALYNDVLGRVPSTAEVNTLVAAMAEGATPLDVATGFFNSTEYRTNLVDADYETYLGRPPETAGLAGWLAQFAEGMTDQEVLANIFGSPEGFAKWS